MLRVTAGAVLSTNTFLWTNSRLNAYYIYIHPYLPLLPPPANPQYDDCPVEIIPLSYQADRSTLPYWPTSTLGLALSALLVLIPLPKEADPLSEPATLLRRSYAQLYAQAAEQALENNAEYRQGNMNMITYPSTYALHQPSLLHPDMPANLEPILALLVLTVYDYCQRGNRKTMRARAHQALTAALDISLHAMGSEAPEAQKRAWWMTVCTLCAFRISMSNGLHVIDVFGFPGLNLQSFGMTQRVPRPTSTNISPPPPPPGAYHVDARRSHHYSLSGIP